MFWPAPLVVLTEYVYQDVWLLAQFDKRLSEMWILIPNKKVFLQNIVDI